MSDTPKLTIIISLYLDDNQIAHRTTSNWEVAEMNLGSLRRWFGEQQAKTEAEEELSKEQKEDLM